MSTALADVRTLADLIAERASLGDKVLARIRGHDLSYGTADRRSSRWAAGFRQLGIGRADVVAQFGYNSVEHVLSWFACAKTGAIWAPLNASLQSGDLAYSLREVGPKIILVDDELLPVFLRMLQDRGDEFADLRVFLVASTLSDRSAAPYPSSDTLDTLSDQEWDRNAAITAESPACITFTGGSTGLPKGALVPHGYLLAAARRYAAVTGGTPSDVHYGPGHLFHVGGQQNGLLGPMYCGMRTHFNRWFSASSFWTDAAAAGATITNTGVAISSILLQRPPSEAERAHSFRLGIGTLGSWDNPEKWAQFEERFGFPVLQAYGQTETGVLISSETPDDRRPGSCGRAEGINGVEIKIVDPQGSFCADGDEGEIVVRPAEPASFMLGYYGHPDVTAERWRGLWHHTGDLGRISEGYLIYLGRMGHFIRRAGENVSVDEIERLLTGHPLVEDAAITAVTSSLGDEEIRAWLALKPGAALSADELRAWCADRVAYFKVPKYVEFIPEIPRTLTKREVERFRLVPTERTATP
ncbi:AMP-binding protein [Actinacidiphila sp. ITFR-21]|uniref:AMP-binding protein n=1 Tax=Actinacidiphila sp. ITFR-21 TaxID=3075199 RepID=UPI0028894CC7|nr:AMP-binding protein [Streptomyces sp. ITFR-21]WNI14258.1 AMP-binding protein [Streptomyces sp. ITFR-21]